jgi:hypothetical protein
MIPAAVGTASGCGSRWSSRERHRRPIGFPFAVVLNAATFHEMNLAFGVAGADTLHGCKLLLLWLRRDATDAISPRFSERREGRRALSPGFRHRPLTTDREPEVPAHDGRRDAGLQRQEILPVRKATERKIDPVVR